MHTNSSTRMIYSKYMVYHFIYSCYTNLGTSESIFTWHGSWHYYRSGTWCELRHNLLGWYTTGIGVIATGVTSDLQGHRNWCDWMYNTADITMCIEWINSMKYIMCTFNRTDMIWLLLLLYTALISAMKHSQVFTTQHRVWTSVAHIL